MPTRPAQFRPQGSRTKAERDREHDAHRRRTSDTRRLYNTAAWRGIRLDQLGREPLCKFCLEKGRLTPATVCDHVEPHRGDVAKFFAGPFQSLCGTCHNSTKQAEERGERPG